jgi:hypothetical protein
MINLLKEWLDCDRIKVFEVAVTDRRDGSRDYLTFDIDIVDNQFVAQHEPLNKEQRDSEFVAAVKIAVDPDFSLDENLQELYDLCIDAINSSEFFTLRDDSYENNDNIAIYTLPAYWTSYLINGDCSDMSDSEIAEVDKFCRDKGCCVGCSEEIEEFRWKNDANKLGGSTREFYFEVKKS